MIIITKIWFWFSMNHIEVKKRNIIGTHPNTILHKNQSNDNYINTSVYISLDFLFSNRVMCHEIVVKWTHPLITVYWTNLTPYVYIFLCEFHIISWANIIIVHALDL